MTDSRLEHIARYCAEALELPPMAIAWLQDLFTVEQHFDDYADGDPVSREQLNALIWKALVSMPSNPFFMANAGALLPVLANSILQWQASDAVEKAGMKEHHGKAYMWRASWYAVLLQVFAIVHGPEVAARDGWKCMAAYGETLEGYLEEMSNG